MSLNIISKIKDIVQDPNCVINALESLLPHCQTPENTVERMWFSIQLTECEYKAAALSFPAVCLSKTDLHSCMRALESREQWWTSYNGNYQTIAKICVEYQPEFEAQKAAQMYRNFLGLTKNYHDDLSRAYSDLTDRFEQTSCHQQDLAVISSQIQDIQQQFSQFVQDLSVKLSNNTNQAITLQNLALEAIDSMTQWSLLNQELQSELGYIAKELIEVGEMTTEIHKVQQSTLQSTINASTIAKQTVHELKEHTGAILSIVSSFRLFWNFMKSFWLISVVLLCLVILKFAIGRHPRQPRSLQPQLKETAMSDLFY